MLPFLYLSFSGDAACRLRVLNSAACTSSIEILFWGLRISDCKAKALKASSNAKSAKRQGGSLRLYCSLL